MPVEQTGLDFAHEWTPPAGYQLELYNSLPGGGLCIGDYDGDDLPDIFLTQPHVGSMLYRNLGGVRFQNVTESAGIGDHQKALGVAFVDIDGDGDLDLYVCNREEPNCLYINAGNGTFKDEAPQRGLAFNGASVMAAFADYDRDGDLDGFLVTYRKEPASPVPPPKANPDGSYEIPDEHREYVDVIVDKDGVARTIKAGQRDHLYQNNGDGTFTDVSASAGIGNQCYWGLSSAWWDYNLDGYLDLYISNDFYSPDELYRNNGDGTFTDVAPQTLPHTPWYSMGTDVADINNDGLFDFMGSDMSGSNHYKQKASMGDMSKNAWFLVHGEPRQVMRNALYLNTGTRRFMEIAQMAGVANTDWTWSLKFADLDEDGWTDLFVTNGMTRDWTNSDTRARADAAQTDEERIRIWAESPERRDPNLAYRNSGTLRFEDVSDEWGLSEEIVSYGAALGDLDGDGDLDLIVNNASREASVYINRAHDSSRILLRLNGKSNRWGIGSTVKLTAGGIQQSRMMTSTQGYLAANEPLLHFGLGDANTIDKIEIHWASGGVQRLHDLPANRYYQVSESSVSEAPESTIEPIESIYEETPWLANISHEEIPFNDFHRQPLLPHQHSQLGPGLACADVNGDGRVDIFMGGASGQAAQLLINKGGGDFEKASASTWQADAECEDMGALFFDLDVDGDDDLYVVSGGVECEPGDEVLRDRLYLNDGSGTFTKGELPDLRDSGSSVSAADFDNDGDLDLFVGSRIVPGQYPISPVSRLLVNDKGTLSQFGEGFELGLVTSAIWSDADADGWTDLLVATELGPVRLLRNAGAKLVDDTNNAGLESRTGWFNGIAGGDFDRDGDIDYVVGNLGRNTKYHPTLKMPYLLYYGDFENTGRKHLVEAEFEDDKLFPMRGKSCSTNAMPHLGEKFSTFHNFASASLAEVYGNQRLQDSHRFTATSAESGVLLNDGKGHFDFLPLPDVAQASPAFGIKVVHANADPHLDLLIAGNFYGPQSETGRFDGGIGVLLTGRGDGTFEATPAVESGIVLPGDAKAAITADLDGNGTLEFLISNNGGSLQCFKRALPLAGSNLARLNIGKRTVIIHSDGAREAVEMHAGSGYLSQSEPLLVLPAGARIE